MLAAQNRGKIALGDSSTTWGLPEDTARTRELGGF